MLQDNPRQLRQDLEHSSKDINEQDPEGCAPLYLAVSRQDVECIELLLAYGADPGIRDRHGYNILTRLDWENSMDETNLLIQDRCLQLLIKYGRDRHGNDLFNCNHPLPGSMLSVACFYSRHTAVKMLLAAGAQIQGRNPREYSALDMCIVHDSRESLELILRETQQLESSTKEQCLETLKNTKCYSSTRTLQMLIEAQVIIHGLDIDNWEWLAAIHTFSEWRSWPPSRKRLVGFNRWKHLYKEFKKDLRLRAGLDPVLSPILWSGGEEQIFEHESEDKSEDEFHSEIDDEVEESERGESEDAVKNHDV